MGNGSGLKYRYMGALFCTRFTLWMEFIHLLPLHSFIHYFQCSLMDSNTVLDVAKEDHQAGHPA